MKIICLPVSNLFFFIIISQEVSKSAFKVCVKDSQGISRNHDPMAVDYAVIGGKHLREIFKVPYPLIVTDSKVCLRIND